MPFLLANDSIEILVPAGQKICVTSYGAGTAKIETATEPGNYPVAFSLLTSITNSDYTSSGFTRDTTVKITAGLCDAEYVIGVSPVATKDRFQPAAVAITGGSINGTTVGQATPSSGSFTNLIASENVGIGVTPSAWRSSEKAIDIAGGAAIAGVANEARIYANAFVDATPAFRYKATGAASLYSQSGGGHLWNVAPSGTAGNTITFTQAMTVDSAGNLGLGVTPSAWGGTYVGALQVRSAALYSASDLRADVASNAFFNGTGFVYVSNGFASAFSQVSGQHRWFTAPSGTAGNAISFTQAMALLANNNLLVGTTSDSGYRFTLNGNGTYFTDATYSGIIGKASVVQGSTGITPTADFAVRSDSNLIIFAGGGTERSRFTTAGNRIDYQPAESAQNTSATLTIAQLQSQIITSNAAVTLTLPTGTALEGYTNAMAVNTSFEVVFIATTANAITIAANGNTTIGSLTVSGNTSGVFRFRKTATNSFTVYRIS